MGNERVGQTRNGTGEVQGVSKEPYPEHPILLVDDEVNILDSTKATLRLHGITNVECCRDSRQVMTLLKKKKFSVILLDILMPHINGNELLPGIVAEYPEIPVIMLTALDERKTAVECMKDGASDYLVKPTDTPDLLKVIREALALIYGETENDTPPSGISLKDLKNPEAFSGIITESPKMYQVFKEIEEIAPSKLSVLITG
jgi:DNA-binding NtrC family response regulator